MFAMQEPITCLDRFIGEDSVVRITNTNYVVDALLHGGTSASRSHLATYTVCTQTTIATNLHRTAGQSLQGPGGTHAGTNRATDNGTWARTQMPRHFSARQVSTSCAAMYTGASSPTFSATTGHAPFLLVPTADTITAGHPSPSQS